MVWAVISSSNNRKLTFIEKNIDDKAHIDILEQNLLEMEDKKLFESDECIRLMIKTLCVNK
jgi:hypothetical protein